MHYTSYVIRYKLYVLHYKLLVIWCTSYFICLNGGWYCVIWTWIVRLRFNTAVSHAGLHLKLHNYIQKLILECSHLHTILNEWYSAWVMTRKNKHFSGSARRDIGDRCVGKPSFDLLFGARCIYGDWIVMTIQSAVCREWSRNWPFWDIPKL